jgi:hypothetical protein
METARFGGPLSFGDGLKGAADLVVVDETIPKRTGWLYHSQKPQ